MSEPEMLRERLGEVASELCEHFEAVQILCSYSDDSGTHFITKGSGNWYARQGMAHDFIGSAQADINAEAIVNKQGDV